jgi:hypothetical protein
MHFQHSDEIWRDFPHLVPGILFAAGITDDVAVDSRSARFTAVARSRLAEAPVALVNRGVRDHTGSFSGPGTAA